MGRSGSSAATRAAPDPRADRSAPGPRVCRIIRGLVRLEERQVEVGPRRLVDLQILHVRRRRRPRYANRPSPPDPLANRIGGSPQNRRASVRVHDGHRRGLLVVVIRELTAGDDRNPERAEVVGADGVRQKRQIFAACAARSRRSSTRCARVSRNASGMIRRERGGLNAGIRARRVEQMTIEHAGHARSS